MSTDLIIPVESQSWYINLVDDCISIVVEKVFESRWSLIEGYHQLGERVKREEGFEKYAKGNKLACKTLAQNIGISDRTLYYAIQFAAKYPLLDSVPLGKNISWNKLITKYLPAPKENGGEGHEHVWEIFERCSICKKVK